MRIRFLILAMVISATPAWACNSDLISVQDDWTAANEVRNETTFTHINVTYAYDGERPIRMIDGLIAVGDVLGGQLAVLWLNRDERMGEGDTSTISIATYGPDLPRLAELDRDDVTFRTCVRGIVYEDGTRETFE